MRRNASSNHKNTTLVLVGLSLAFIFVGGAELAAWGERFAVGTVHDQLAQEKIFFPAKGSAALDPQEFPGLQEYAGQQVDSGPKAKAYADQFIWVHMMKSSGNKTYAEVSSAAQADPTNTKLAALKATLFQGDMLRSSLLTAYAFSVFGLVAYYAKLALLAAAALALLSGFWPLLKTRASH